MARVTVRRDKSVSVVNQRTPLRVIVGGRGGAGPRGEGLKIDKTGTFAERVGYDDHPEGFVFASVDGDGDEITTSVLFRKESGASADWGPPIRIQGNPGESVKGDPGDSGWSAVLAVVPDGVRRVHQVVNWVGGEGDPPPAGFYLGILGPVANIEDAVDIRGTQGGPGIDGTSLLTRVSVVDTAGGDPAEDYEDGKDVDGRTLLEGQVVLRASESDPELNGPYVVPASGAASRHPAFDTFDSLPGVFFSAMEGDAHADTLWRVTSDLGGTLGSDPVTVEQFTSGGGIGPNVYALPNDPSVDLREFMDIEYGVGEWAPYGGVGVGSDIGPALNLALDALRSRYGRGIVRIPGGSWRMTTAPTAEKLIGNIIKGTAGFGGAVITYDGADSGAMFDFTTLDGFSGAFSGGGLEDLALFLEEGYGSSSVTAIKLGGDATYMPSRCNFHNLNVSARGSSYWYRGFDADGTARTSPQGIRHVNVKNLTIFSCHNRGFIARNAVQWYIENTTVHTSIGDGERFEIGGGGAANTNSIQVHLAGINANVVQIENASRVFGTLTCGTLAVDTSWTDSRLFGLASGGVSGTPGATATFTNVNDSINTRELLTANRTYYLNSSTGDDGNTGLSSGSPFETMEHALATAASLDLGVYDVTIEVADGTYGPIVPKRCVGAGRVFITGNTGTPANCVIAAGSAPAINGVNVVTQYTISGFRLTGTGFGILAQGPTNFLIGEMDYATTGSAQVYADSGAFLTLSANYTISSNAQRHWWTLVGGYIQCVGRTITLTGTPAFSNAFASCQFAYQLVSGNTFSGAATGKRYDVTRNGVIFTNGGGASYLPGNAAGTDASGGQYL